MIPHPVTIPGYELLAELGRGETGVVYRARHIAIDIELAIKVMLIPNEAERSERTWRFHRESQAMAKAHHPFIASVFDAAKLEGGIFYARELVEGSTLEDLVAAGTIDAREGLGILSRVTKAIGHVHKQGLVHRNLRPSNVLVSPAGSPKLIGFSRACDADEASGRGTDLDVRGLQELLAWLYMASGRSIPPELDRLRQRGAGRSAAAFAKAIEDHLQQQQ